MKLKQLILFSLLTALIFACNKNDDDNGQEYEASGIIVSSDLGLCTCCGGWVLVIDEVEGDFRFESLPDDANIDLSQTNIPVLFDYNIDRECGGITYVNIEAIELE